MANASQLLWSGEHWIAYLREHGRDTNSASIGIYHTRYSPAGEGSAALIDVPGDDGFQAIITDNREVLAFTMERVRAAPPRRSLQRSGSARARRDAGKGRRCPQRSILDTGRG